MATISKDKGRIWDSLQFKFGLSYILIIAGVLLLLNTYPLRVSQDLVFRSKATTLQSSVSVMVYSLSGLDRLTEENVSQAMAVVEETGLSRILVTDSAGKVLYDTRETGSAVGKYTFYSEIVQALEGYDAFSCSYRDGAFRSRTASPVLYQNRIIGAVYAYEYDTEQAALLEGLQSNLLKLSAGIAAAVVLLSILLSRMLTRKISTLLTAIRKVRAGAYEHRTHISGRDEIAQIGEEFNSLTDRLQTTETLRRRFVSDASHELKTPLTSISGIAEIIRNGIVKPEDIPHFAGKIYDESQRLITLIGDIIKLSRLDENQVPMERETVDMLEMARDVVQQLSSVARKSGVTLVANGSHGQVQGVRQVLGEMVYNLCENAVKYNRAGGRVWVDVQQVADHVVLRVKDTGIGIPAAEQGRIFERFYRVDKSHSKAVGGTGLGLSIVKHGAALHHATISVSSEPEQGTEITLTFPAA